ncbi:AAA family ATPase [Streptomyces ortus]|nr:AAA family ATPase [Streptomyces ortus]
MTTVTTPSVDANLDAGRAAVAGEIVRTDGKSSLLLAFTGEVLVGLASPADHDLPPATRLCGALAALALAAASVLLLIVVRPRLRGDARGSFTHWARLDEDGIRACMHDDHWAAHIRTLSTIAVRKFGHLQRAVDLILGALALLRPGRGRRPGLTALRPAPHPRRRSGGRCGAGHRTGQPGPPPTTEDVSMNPLMLPDLPDAALIGASGAGKSTLAATWPASQVLSSDTLRGQGSDDCGCQDQDVTDDAFDVLHLLLEHRMARGLNTIVDATNVTRASRAPLLAAAKRHHMPAVAILVDTPASVCVDRQGPRPAAARVPDEVVVRQHKEMVRSHPDLIGEGFTQVDFADRLYRLEPHLKHLSETRTAGLGLDGGEGLGDLLLARRFFGPEILPLWQWKPGSDLAGGDRVAQIRLGQQYLTLALRTDVDGAGDYGFDVLLPCPHDDECTGWAWVPVYSITCLYRALTGDLDDSEDIVCTVHCPADDTGQDADEHAQQALQEVGASLR